MPDGVEPDDAYTAAARRLARDMEADAEHEAEAGVAR